MDVRSRKYIFLSYVDEQRVEIVSSAHKIVISEDLFSNEDSMQKKRQLAQRHRKCLC